MTVIELVFPGVRLVESIILYFVRLSNVGSNRNIMPSIFSADVYWPNVFSVMPAIFIFDGGVSKVARERERERLYGGVRKLKAGGSARLALIQTDNRKSRSLYS